MAGKKKIAAFACGGCLLTKLEEEANEIGNKKISRTDIITIATREFIETCKGNEDHLKTMLEKYLLA